MPPRIYVCCPGCRDVLCHECAGAPAGLLCPLLRCPRCFSAQVPREGVAAVRELFRHLVRDGTRAGHVRGLRDFLSYTDSIGVRRPLPASPEVVLGYIAYSLMGRGFVLDAATVDIYLGGVRAWHEQAKFETGGAVANPVATTAVRSALRIALKNFKKKSDPARPLELDEWLGVMARGFDLNTRVGRHRQLVVVLCALGPLRPVAAKHLRCTYALHPDGSVSYAGDSHVQVVRPAGGGRRDAYVLLKVTYDKNLRRGQTRLHPIPYEAMGVRPVQLLEDYLREIRPPSGGYLLTAPKGLRRDFYGGRYTAFSAAVRGAFVRAFPGVDPEFVGGSSPRKCMPQWMHDAGHSLEEIADVGGWSLRAALDAVHTYFKTKLRRQLAIKHGLLGRLGLRA